MEEIEFENLMAMCENVHSLRREVDVILANRGKKVDPRSYMMKRLGGRKKSSGKWNTSGVVASVPVYRPPDAYIPGIMHTLRDEALQWFIDPRVASNPVSLAEQKIIDELNRYRIQWYREVSFHGLVLPTGGHARYDFYIPSLSLVIEYDGQQYHNTTARIEVDDMKDVFCRRWKVDVVRLNKKHYYNMENTIAVLMNKYHVIKK